MFLAASPRIFDTDGSPVHIPKLTGMAEPSWHGETEQVDEVDPTWDEVTLLPSNMASVKSLTPAQQRAGSPVGHRAQAALRDRMVRDVAAKIDTALVAGDGAATAGGDVTPTGLLNYTGTQELTGVGAPTLDDLHDAEGLILAANVDPSWLRWFMTSRDFVNIRKLKDGQQRYPVQPDPSERARSGCSATASPSRTSFPPTAAPGRTSRPSCSPTCRSSSSPATSRCP